MNKFCKFILITWLASCTSQEAMLSSQEETIEDSTALHIAVIPVMDCLPVYYAERIGLLKEAGLEARLLYHEAQMDVDTTLSFGHAEIGWSDLIRGMRLGNDFHALAQTKGDWALMAVRGKRINKLQQMKERMVAIARLSATDYWCKHIVEKTDALEQEDVYRPQINNVPLRSGMIQNGLLDAAILPEPYASYLSELGCTELFRTPQEGPHFGIFLAREDSSRREQIQHFLEIYDLAVDKLNEKCFPDSTKAILRDIYHLPAAYVDTLEIPILSKLGTGTNEDSIEAKKFLEQ